MCPACHQRGGRHLTSAPPLQGESTGLEVTGIGSAEGQRHPSPGTPAQDGTFSGTHTTASRLTGPHGKIVHIQGPQRGKLAKQGACSFIPRPPSRGSPSHKSLSREKPRGLGSPERERVPSQASQDLGCSGDKRSPWPEAQVLTPTCSVTQASCHPSPGLRFSICKVSIESPHPPESSSHGLLRIPRSVMSGPPAVSCLSPSWRDSFLLSTGPHSPGPMTNRAGCS